MKDTLEDTSPISTAEISARFDHLASTLVGQQVEIPAPEAGETQTITVSKEGSVWTARSLLQDLKEQHPEASRAKRIDMLTKKYGSGPN